MPVHQEWSWPKPLPAVPWTQKFCTAKRPPKSDRRLSAMLSLQEDAGPPPKRGGTYDLTKSEATIDLSIVQKFRQYTFDLDSIWPDQLVILVMGFSRPRAVSPSMSILKIKTFFVPKNIHYGIKKRPFLKNGTLYSVEIGKTDSLLPGGKKRPPPLRRSFLGNIEISIILVLLSVKVLDILL